MFRQHLLVIMMIGFFLCSSQIQGQDNQHAFSAQQNSIRQLITDWSNEYCNSNENENVVFQKVSSHLQQLDSNYYFSDAKIKKAFTVLIELFLTWTRRKIEISAQVLNMAWAVVNILTQKPTPIIFIDKVETQSLAKLFSRSKSDALRTFFLFILTRQASRLEIQVSALIDMAFNVKANRNESDLGISMNNHPFVENGKGICRGIAAYTLFLNSNFIFDSSQRELDRWNMSGLFNFDVLTDKSGTKLKDLGFKKEVNGSKFVIPGYASLRDLTANYLDQLNLLERTYENFYSDPTSNLVEITALKLMRHTIKTFPKIATELTNDPASYRNITTKQLELARTDFAELESLTKEHLLVLASFIIVGKGHHVVLVTKGKENGVILVLDNAQTYEGRMRVLKLTDQGVFYDFGGWYPVLFRSHKEQSLPFELAKPFYD